MMKDAHCYNHYRETVIGAVVDLAKEHKDIVFLDADLSSCITSTTFKKEFPSRFFNAGIAEANMAAVAGGMASAGLTPFIHSFACFATRRAYDQILISIGYTNRTVHIIGSDPGIVAQYNGGTHMPFEDIALMRQVPSFVIIEPSDAQSLYALTQQVYFNGKPSYIRTPRKGISFRYSADDEIKLGKAIELADGSDVALVATGVLMVDLALETKEELEKRGIKATVIDWHTVRPMDTETLDRIATRCGRVIVMENGRYAGGVGESIAAYYAANSPVKMDFLSIKDEYGQVGPLSYLKEAYGFTLPAMLQKVENILAR